jgi:hypothetical protein
MAKNCAAIAFIHSSDTDDDAIKKGNKDEQNGNDHGRTVAGIGRAINRELRGKFFLPARRRLISAQFFASLKSANGWKEFRENRKQLRCCHWIRLPNANLREPPGRRRR